MFPRLVGFMTLLDHHHGKSIKINVSYKIGILDLKVIILLTIVLLHNYHEDFLSTVVIQIWFCLE